MKFASYELVPGDVQEKLLKAYMEETKTNNRNGYSSKKVAEISATFFIY